MAVGTWPSGLIHDGNPEISLVDDTILNESMGGQRFGLNPRANPRMRYRYNYTVRSNVTAPSPYQAYSELGALRYLVALCRGRSNTVYVADPDTGSSVLCRLAEDETTFRQRGHLPWWDVTVTFESEA